MVETLALMESAWELLVAESGPRCCGDGPWDGRWGRGSVDGDWDASVARHQRARQTSAHLLFRREIERRTRCAATGVKRAAVAGPGSICRSWRWRRLGGIVRAQGGQHETAWHLVAGAIAAWALLVALLPLFRWRAGGGRQRATWSDQP